ncbi:TIGR02186 family protein [Salipiger sp.]|uniref:TIGR02186 family protein n=1 Tax=Salipiger sp. TaxID=2078585 RepID=UPI003A96FB66
MDSAEFGWLPRFYTVASSDPLSDILDPVEALRYGISPAALIHFPSETDNFAEGAWFVEAMLHLSARSGRVIVHEGDITCQDGVLFSGARGMARVSDIKKLPCTGQQGADPGAGSGRTSGPQSCRAKGTLRCRTVSAGRNLKSDG